MSNIPANQQSNGNPCRIDGTQFPENRRRNLGEKRTEPLYLGSFFSKFAVKPQPQKQKVTQNQSKISFPILHKS
jgi:hypothetical protein